MELSEWVTGRVVIKIKGEPLEMEMTVPATPVNPRRMLPIFQQMSNGFVDLSVGEANKNGERISCKKGCGACCSQPVPISEVEAYNIAELVESMPEPRRSEIRKKFADAVEHFSDMNWFDRMNEFATRPEPENPDMQYKDVIEAGIEYFNENIPCPFLEEGSCSIHQERPLACREYLVMSPAENCSHPTAEGVRMVPLLLKPSRSLRAFARTKDSPYLPVLPLIRALEFAEKYREDFEEKTGPEWAADFIGKLTGSEVATSGAGQRSE